MCVRMYVYTSAYTLFFFRLRLEPMLLITDIYTSIKITQAYRLNHLIDYLVCLLLLVRSFVCI